MARAVGKAMPSLSLSRPRPTIRTSLRQQLRRQRPPRPGRVNIPEDAGRPWGTNRETDILNPTRWTGFAKHVSNHQPHNNIRKAQKQAKPQLKLLWDEEGG